MFKETTAKIKRELAYYKALTAHKRTPRISKVLLACALAYLVSPIDLIPDFIPVIGHLDDLITDIPLIVTRVFLNFLLTKNAYYP